MVLKWKSKDRVEVTMHLFIIKFRSKISNRKFLFFFTCLFLFYLIPIIYFFFGEERATEDWGIENVNVHGIGFEQTVL